MLTGANQQILSAYEELGMKPDEIAAEFDYDLVAVKATLMQYSAEYRKACKNEPSLDYSNSEQLEAKNIIISIMRSTEDENLRARLALKVRDDGKGRLDVANNLMNGANINIVMFNAQLQKARAAKLKSKQLPMAPAPTQSPIDVPSSVEKVA